MKETLYTIRWLATGDVEPHLTIDEVWAEAFKNRGTLHSGFIVPNKEYTQPIAIVTKEDT